MKPNETQQKIRRWLTEDKAVFTEPTMRGDIFRFGIPGVGDTKIEVFQPADLVNGIIIGSAIALGREHLARVGQMNAKERTELIWKLRRALIAIDVEFDGLTMPLTEVHISQRISNDGLTKDAFTQRLLSVRRGIAAFIWTIQELLGEAPDLSTFTGLVN